MKFLKIIRICLLLVIFGGNMQLQAQEFAVPNNYGDHRMHYWRADWITHPDASPFDYGVYHFRRTFDMAAIPDSLKFYISADNRYKLYVNGQYVAMGPARGDMMHWRYETIDIVRYLQPGKNVIAPQWLK